jgi:hypothetical protein
LCRVYFRLRFSGVDVCCMQLWTKPMEGPVQMVAAAELQLAELLSLASARRTAAGFLTASLPATASGSAGAAGGVPCASAALGGSWPEAAENGHEQGAILLTATQNVALLMTAAAAFHPSLPVTGLEDSEEEAGGMPSRSAADERRSRSALETEAVSADLPVQLHLGLRYTARAVPAAAQNGLAADVAATEVERNAKRGNDLDPAVWDVNNRDGGAEQPFINMG